MSALDPLVFELRDRGFAVVDPLGEEQLRDVRRHLFPLPLYNAHVAAYSDGKPLTISEAQVLCVPFASYDFTGIVRCPHLLEAALKLVQNARAFFGQEPVLYSMNVWWSFPGGFAPEKTVTRMWHSDADDVKMLAAFWWLTDVTGVEDGPQQLKRRDTGEIETMLGPAGFCFVTDPAVEHRSLPVLGTRPRLAAWARYGVGQPPRQHGEDKLFAVEDPARVGLSVEDKRIARFILRC